MSKVATSTGVVRRPSAEAPRSGSGARRTDATRQPRQSTQSRDPHFYKRLIIIVCVLLATIAGGWVIWVSPVLGVTSIRVEGNSVVATAAVRSSAGVDSGTPLARVDLGDVAARVSTLPAVASAEVARAWPNTLVVTVHERVPLAVVTVEGRAWVVDKTGTVYLPVTSLPGGKAPATAITLKIAAPGPKDTTTQAALAVVRTLPAAVRKLVGSVEAPSASAVTLRLKDGRTIIWGGADDSAKKARLVAPLLTQAGNQFDVSSPNAVVIR